MRAIVQDVQDAIRTIQKRAVTKYSSDLNNVVIGGHPAGSHLAVLALLLLLSSSTLMLNSYVECDSDANDFKSSLKGICSLSELFDLKLIQNSYLNHVF